MGDRGNGGNPIRPFAHTPILQFPRSKIIKSPHVPIPAFSNSLIPLFSHFPIPQYPSARCYESKCEVLGFAMQHVREWGDLGTGEFEIWRTVAIPFSNSPIHSSQILKFPHSRIPQFSHYQIPPFAFFTFPISEYKVLAIKMPGVRIRITKF